MMRTRFLYGLTMMAAVALAFVVTAQPAWAGDGLSVETKVTVPYANIDTPTGVEEILYTADICEGAQGSDLSISLVSTFGTMDTAQDLRGFSTIGIGMQTDHLATYKVSTGGGTWGQQTSLADESMTLSQILATIQPDAMTASIVT